MAAAGGSIEHGGTDPAPLIRVEVLFDRIDVALIVLHLNASDWTLNVDEKCERLPRGNQRLPQPGDNDRRQRPTTNASDWTLNV